MFAPGVEVDLEPIYTLADQKAENSKNDNSCSQRCPKCHQLPWEYKTRCQDPLSTDGGNYDGFYSPASLFDMTFSLLHVDLNGYKDIFRLACLKFMSRYYGIEVTNVTEEFKWVFETKMAQMEEAYLARNIVLNKVKENGGTSNTG